MVRKLIQKIPDAEAQMNGAKVPRKSRLFDPDYTLKFAEDQFFVPPQRYTYQYGKPMEIVEDRPAGARRRRERSFSVVTEPYYGRPPTTPTANELHERFVDMTYWLDGEWFTDDLATPLSQSRRHPLDPEELTSCLDLLRHWLSETVGSKIKVVVREVEDPLKLRLLNPDSKRPRVVWSTKRATMDEVHRTVHYRGPIDSYDVADNVFGPFDSIHEHRQARVKVEALLKKAKIQGLVDCTADRHHLWSSVRDPSIPLPCQPATLFTAQPPRLKKGRYCVTTEGEALLKLWSEEEQQDFEEHVGRIAQAMDLRVGSRPNDEEHGDDPMPRKKVYRSHYHVKCNLLRAYDVLTGIRKGQYAPGGRGGPTLCYFKFWARMLYAPIPSGTGDWMLDERASRIPEPTTAEARYMEQKAFRKLRALEELGLVVRRRAPDGSTILFENIDPESANYPLVDNAVASPTPSRMYGSRSS